MLNSSIQVNGLQKSYKELHVLKGVDFEVEKGSIFALLGSNGAGKTTIVKILTMLALTWIAVIAGLSATSVDGAGAFAYPLIFLPFISSAFVPTESMPPVVRAFAENQPVTFIVDAIRSLLAGQPVGNDIWIALAWCVGIMLVAYFFAMRVYKKRV